MNTEELIALRRDLHAHPEPAFLESRTAGVVLSRLSGRCDTLLTGQAAMRTGNIPDYPGGEGTAVVAELAGDRPGPTWGLRFDMDALPITESAEPGHPPAALGFRSDNGAMHACGHDAHTAIGVALAHRLADRRFPGRVRLLFQPAEEGSRGAAAMLEAGAAEGVEKFVALHLGNGLPAGTVVGGAVGLLATSKLRARFTGRPAHAGASPHLGRNALAAAATGALGVLALPRFPGARTRVNVGTLHAGVATNVVPHEAELTCEVRSDDEEVAAELERRARVTLEAAGEMYEVAVGVSRTGRSTTLTPDDALVDAVVRAASGEGRDVRRHHRLSASDDASLWAREVRRNGGEATYVLVGGGNTAPHHHPLFDIDERAMVIAVDILENLLRTG